MRIKLNTCTCTGKCSLIFACLLQGTLYIYTSCVQLHMYVYKRVTYMAVQVYFHKSSA